MLYCYGREIKDSEIPYVTLMSVDPYSATINAIIKRIQEEGGLEAPLSLTIAGQLIPFSE